MRVRGAGAGGGVRVAGMGLSDWAAPSMSLEVAEEVSDEDDV